jgi:anti-sigma factor RsiW
MQQYLLGRLPEEEEAELERRYLADESLFEELLAIEDDLRDAYVRGELSMPDHEAFQQRLLAVPQQRQEQEFAHALRRNLQQTSVEVGPTGQRIARWKSLLQDVGAWPRAVLVPALTFIILILMAGSWWLGRRSVQQQEHQTASRAPGEGSSKVGEPRVEEAMVTVVLKSGLMRGGEEESRPVVIPPGVSQVRLEARIEIDYPRYEAVLQTIESKRIWSQGDLIAQPFSGGKRVVLDLSSTLLPPSDYILTLRGLPTSGSPETVAEYSFSVRTK